MRAPLIEALGAAPKLGMLGLATQGRLVLDVKAWPLAEVTAA